MIWTCQPKNEQKNVIIAHMTHTAPFHRRSAKGEQNFTRYIIPRIHTLFPGKWISLNGAPADWEHGVDFIHVHGHQVQTISARVWMSMPHDNFTIRHYRTSAPERPLEYASRMEAYRTGGYMSDWTVEGFVHRTGLHIGAIPTRKLYQHLDRMGDLCPRFMVQNKTDHTIFRKVAWMDVYDDMERFFFKPIV